MKRLLILFSAFFLLSTILAEPLCIIKNGNFTRNGYWLRKEQNTISSPQGVVFNGKDAAIWIKLNKFSAQMRNFSVIADVIIDALPEKGTVSIAARPGYHNVLGIDPNGRVNLSVYANDKKTRKIIDSKNKVKIGEKVRLAGVIEKISDSEYDLVLYINGKEEKRATLYQEIFPYDRDYFYVGAVNLSSDGLFFKGKILNMWVAETALPQHEINALK